MSYFTNEQDVRTFIALRPTSFTDTTTPGEALEVGVNGNKIVASVCMYNLTTLNPSNTIGVVVQETTDGVTWTDTDPVNTTYNPIAKYEWSGTFDGTLIASNDCVQLSWVPDNAEVTHIRLNFVVTGTVSASLFGEWIVSGLRVSPNVPAAYNTEEPE